MSIIFNPNNYIYFIFIGSAWGIAYKLGKYFLNRYNISISGYNYLFFGLFISSFFGAKILFFFTDFKAHSFFNTKFLLGGGFVFYGGLIGGLIFFLVCTYFKPHFLNNAFLLVPSLVIGHAIGRVGCFFSNCCFGMICNLPWSIYQHGFYRHPTQLYELVLLLFLFSLIIYLLSKDKKSKLIYSSYFFLYGGGRFIIEFFRSDVHYKYFFDYLSVSQLISLILMGLGLIFFCFR